MATLPYSTFLDFTSWHGIADLSTTVAQAYGAVSTGVAPGAAFNVALILPRANGNDPSALLASNWATRQTTLASLNAEGTLWTTYGADQGQYDSTIAQLRAQGIPILGLGGIGDGYVTSAASRTIWVNLDNTSFNWLFGQQYEVANMPPGAANIVFWSGSLTLPDSIELAGVYFDTNFSPAIQAQSTNPYSPAPGPQSIGNAAPGNAIANLYPQQVAQLYDFPLNGNVGVTGTLALVEPGVGSSLLPGTTATFGALLGAYLAGAHVQGSPTVYTVANGGQQFNGSAGERTLDIAVAAAINPNAAFGLYAGSGPQATAFTAYQSAIWDTTHNPSVLSSSFFQPMGSAPGSPFFAAYQGLFADAALRNMSVFLATGDNGSGSGFATGLDNLQYSNGSPYAVQVGGTSLTLTYSASSDSTTSLLLTQAQAQNPAVLWSLMQSGLKTMPTATTPGETPFLESVWNVYTFQNGTLSGGGGGSGVDTRLGIPVYQSGYGLTPTVSDPTGGTGRGLPDVSALAGGDTLYIVPMASMEGHQTDGGTSASAPLWASLALQINAVFQDQSLPQLGYANDLLYIASVIAPGAFNDIVAGNNVSSFTGSNSAMIPTGFGYVADTGYDLASGLGSPNGLLLARALTAVAHQQMYFGSSPPLLDQDGGGWTSAADQSLLFQTTSTDSGGVTVGIGVGSSFMGFASNQSSGYAWTSQLAQQVLQADFDPNLVRLFDKQGQGALVQVHAHAGVGVAVSIDQQIGNPLQASPSNPFGFSDFFGNDGTVRVARAVAEAETVGGLDDQTAIVRVRQNGTDSLSVTFYEVDDFAGKIGNLNPGDAGYAQAAQERAYQVGSGGISMGGPGYGNFQQTTLQNVDAGDKVAMFLTDNTTGAVYWAFAQANESFAGQKVGHLWNYGLNTWGWEDQYGRGDGDYNDMIVQLDFTSAYGQQWLMHG